MAEGIRDMSDPEVKQRIIRYISGLEGMHRLEVVKYRPRRSDRQNAYYWPVIVHTFGVAIREAGDNLTDDQAHELLKHQFLQCEHVNKITGEVMGRTKSTTELDTNEFSEYVEKCAAWLAGHGIDVPADRTHESEAA